MEYLYPRQLEVFYNAIEMERGCINVPMGFGKTLISICLAIEKYEKTGKPSLVIASKTLIPNWISEIKKFTPDLKYVVLHSNFIKNIENYNIPNDTVLVITTSTLCSKYYNKFRISEKFIRNITGFELHPVFRMNALVNVQYYNLPYSPYIDSETENIEDISVSEGVLYAYKWGILLIDEIQNYTNIGVVKCKSLCAISAYNKWGLSGTLFAEPKINNIMGYYMLIDSTEFPRRIDTANIYVQGRDYEGYLKTVIYKESIENTKLPDVKKIFIHNRLNQQEENVYTTLRNVLAKITRHVKSLNARNTTEYRRYTSYKLVLIAYLRQMLVIPLLPIIKCFSDHIDINNDSELTQIVLDEFDDHEYLNNIESLRSSRLIEIENTINRHNDSRILIFTSYRKVLKVLKGELRINPDRMLIEIESKHSMKKRSELVESFRQNENSIMFLTYDIGAEGLNLQFCNIVLFTDTYWNVSKIEQAGARVLRPGNPHPFVYQYYFISNTAIENGILTKQSDKVKLDSEIKHGRMISRIKSLSNNEIIKILETEENLENMRKNFS